VAVILRTPKLLAFPLVTGVLTLGIFTFFFGATAFRPTGHPWMSGEHWQAIASSLFARTGGAASNHYAFTTLGAVYLGVIYFVSMFFATIFNVAFYHEILAALQGQPVSIRRGLSFATTRWKAILLWTLFAGVVGLIIKAIEQRVSFVGGIIARFIGLAWSIAAVFAIPVLVCGEATANPIDVLRKSAGVLKRTWGEALVGYVGLTFGNILAGIFTMAAIVGAVGIAVVFGSYWTAAAIGVIWILALIAFGYVMSVASQIYKGALYLYAADGVIAEPYNQEMLDHAWKWKK
jgi:hypothetical protein